MADNYMYTMSIGGTSFLNYCYSARIEDKRDDEYGQATIVLNIQASSLLDINQAQDIVITRGLVTSTDYTVFRGKLVSYTKDGGMINIIAYDRMWELAKKTANYTYDKNIDTQAGKISAIAEDLIETWGGMTATVVDSGTDITLDKFVVNSDFLLERLRTLADILGWTTYYCPQDDTVHFEPKGYTTFGTDLQVGVNIQDNLIWEYDKSRLANKITITGGLQEVETTETGTVGTGTCTTTGMVLTNEPVSVKVYVDGTLKTGGKLDATALYDYSVDLSNRQILWSSTYTPTAGQSVSVQYSYMVPVKISGQDDASIADHGTFETIETHKDVLTVQDGIERLRDRLALRKDPVTRTQARVIFTPGMAAGMKVHVIDTLNAVDETLLIDKIVYTYPYPWDEVDVGYSSPNEEDMTMNINERVRRLEREALSTSDITVDVRQKDWDVSVYGYTIIQDDTTKDILRTIFWTGEYVEDFRNQDFDSGGSANWNTTLRRLSYT